MKIIRENDVAIYCSKLSKCEISIEEQLERLKKYCRHFGLNIVREYIEVDNVNKPLFNQMIEDIKTKEFNIILSYSFDTLSKNDEDLIRLVNELDKFNYELQLENYYKYKMITKPIIKLPREDKIKEEKEPSKKNTKAKCYPMFRTYELKNPKFEKPVNWVEKMDEDNIRFEENSIFDSDGRYLGINRDVFVISKEITGFARIKSKKPKEQKRELKPIKLF